MDDSAGNWMLDVGCYPCPMKPPLLVLGIFLLTGALLAGAWSLQFNQPGEFESHLFAQSKIFGEFSEMGTAARKQSLLETIERTRHRDAARLIAGTCGIFSLLSFTLAAVWPKSPRSPATPNPPLPAR